MKDWRGIDIVPGQTVLYAVRNGSSHYMVEAQVLEVGDSVKLSVTRRQNNALAEVVTVSNRYITVCSLPESEVETVAVRAERARIRKQEWRAKQAACPHTNTKNYYSYVCCADCYKIL